MHLDIVGKPGATLNLGRMSALSQAEHDNGERPWLTLCRRFFPPGHLRAPSDVGMGALDLAEAVGCRLPASPEIAIFAIGFLMVWQRRRDACETTFAPNAMQQVWNDKLSTQSPLMELLHGGFSTLK
jgi:hypothetical protein